MLPPQLNVSNLRTVDHSSEFASCRDQFLTSPLANTLVRWCFPDLSRQEVVDQTHTLLCTEDFQSDYVRPMLQRVLAETSRGLSISGLDQLPTDRKFLFISNHRCIVTDAALVALNLLASGRGTCKVCVGDNLMSAAGVSELMLLLNGVVIKRSGTRRDVYTSATQVSTYLAQQIEAQRYSVWLSQSPGRTKDGNDHTDPAIIKMLGLAGGGTRAAFEKLHIVPVAISYEFEPCAIFKVRETLLRRQHGTYQKVPGEDLSQIHSSLTANKGGVHLAFGEEIRLSGCAGDDPVSEIVDQIDAQIWRLYRLWESHQAAHTLLIRGALAHPTPSAQAFLELMESQADELLAMGIPRSQSREALLQLYAQPVFNAQRHAIHHAASRSQGKA